jgi:hypothetical protein
MKYTTFKYASGVLYGAELTLGTMSVDTGPSTGGTKFTLMGSNLTNTVYDDVFTGTSLDLVKWSDLSSGSGSVSTGSDHLELSTGTTTGSVAGIRSVQTFESCQFETKVTVPKLTIYPDAEVVLIAYRIYIDSSNYAEMKLVQPAESGTPELIVNAVISGTSVDNFSTSWTTGVSTLKILRWKNYAYFYANGTLLFKTSRFLDSSAVLDLYVDNQTSTYNTVGGSEYIKLKTYMAFDDQIVDDITVISAFRLRGTTPPSINSKEVLGAYKGYVDVSVVTDTVYTRSNFFEYYFDNVLIVNKNDQFDVQLSVIGDSIVRTPVDSVKGLA